MIGAVRPRTVTRRKELAQELRNELHTYRRMTSDEAPTFVDARHRRLHRIAAKVAELHVLEGLNPPTPKETPADATP